MFLLLITIFCLFVLWLFWKQPTPNEKALRDEISRLEATAQDWLDAEIAKLKKPKV